MNSIRQIEVIFDNRLVGHLALTREGLCAFEYSVAQDSLSHRLNCLCLAKKLLDCPFRSLLRVFSCLLY